ncbi:MAG: YbaK/EbsC family protein [Chloroflexota bacterium]|jgi:Cys-tRNA(Pro) deacylase
MHPSARKVSQAAAEIGLDIQILEFDQTTRTAADAAAAIGCQVAQIVKSLMFTVGPEPVMVLVSGNNQLDDRKLAALYQVGRKRVRRANADMVKNITGFSIGGVPPFGHQQPLPVFVDQDLLVFDVVWAAAGTPNAVFAIAPTELVNATGGRVIDIRQERL